MTEASALVTELVAARKRAGLQQKHVAHRMHCTPSSVSMIESGKRGASFDVLDRYARAIGVTVTIRVEPQP